jgi:dipeptidyl aminopeptidase/acylaminoacyl peptidase
MKQTLLAALTFLALVSTSTGQKRPLTHSDYDGWRHISNQHLSNDGKFLAYALFPQEGDGQLIVRNLITGKEFREGIGQLPPPPPPDPEANEEAPPRQRGIELSFTKNGTTLVFSTFPTKAEVDQAKKDKKKAPDLPKNGLRIMNLATGEVARVDRVKSFQVPTKGDGVVAYLKEPASAPTTPAPTGGRRREYGTDLILRTLATGAERTFSDALEFSLSKDGKTLAYAVSAKNDETNGVYEVPTTGDTAPKSLIAGKGKYGKLSFDEKITELAFVGGQPAKLYLWKLDADKATELVSAATPGFPADSIISDRANLTFAKDGTHLFFGYAPKPTPPKELPPAEDRVSVDLWHWKDDNIQPMQKARAGVERNRSFRAVYNLADNKLVPLADRSMNDLIPNDDGRYSLGNDNREYRPMVEYDQRYNDTYVVDNLTGERKLAVKKHLGNVTWSPDGTHAIYFNGQDWMTISVPGGKLANLTAKLPVKFWLEEHDSPDAPRAYGMAGWTKDGKSVILSDHYDLWLIAADGSYTKNLTQGMGRKEHLTLRYVRLDNDPEDKGIDPAKPLLLRAENAETHESGFYRTTLNTTDPPKKLMMAAKNFSNPIKAKDADVLLLTESTFKEFPDLQVTDMNFQELRKVSDANPQQAGINWGTAELIKFKNIDGVPLKATLYKPENFDPKKKYPMIVYIYERLTQGLNNYVEPRPGHTINVSFYVSNGYLILEPDIAYKIGFPGQSALQCVLPAIQAAVDQGFVDENNIGIQGHSWGGYQIAYMITQTNRFKAVAAGAPVANMTSAYDGIRWGPGLPRQFQYEKTQSRIGGTLWEFPMRYIENSPVFMADRVKTPIMMIHNDADDAVPWYQGIEYYLALRRLGKEAYLFSYNGEPHGLRRRPNQKDYTVRLQQYFDYYLKGAPKPDWMEHGIPYLQKPGATIESATPSEQP